MIKLNVLQEGKKVHSGGGFSGKGFKFDEQEAQMVNEKKKFQKAALGMYYKVLFLLKISSSLS